MVGRPREFDRVAALRTARDLFWKQGFESTSMAELVSALDLASARLYAAFGSKEGLFREAVINYMAGEGGFVQRAIEEGSSLTQFVARILEEAIALYTRHERAWGCMIVASATNCSVNNESIRAWLAELRLQQTRAIIARMRALDETGELPNSYDPQVLGDAITSFLHGLSIQARDGIPAHRLRAAASLFREQVVR